MDKVFHSVTLDIDKCKGCINCMKRCPTEAIRVRNGHAQINPEKCIDCGECIRICPNHAKKAVTDTMDMLTSFKYTIALPAPSFYGQFNNLEDTNYVLTGLKQIGFDEVMEVSGAAELISDLTRKLINSDTLPCKKPIISSACPAVLRLIHIRFPELIKNVLPILAPLEVAAKAARDNAIKKTGLKSEEIGIFFISPCPAKVTAVKNPIGFDKSEIDGIISASEIYTKLIGKMNKIENPEDLKTSGIVGISWASSGGEATALLKEKYLAADGIENVIKVLEDMELDKLNNLDFIELNACTGGCVGGVLNIENPFVAKARILRLRKYLPISCNKVDINNHSQFMWTKPLDNTNHMKLDDDSSVAFKMLTEIEETAKLLGGLDCGTCGAPSCRAFAEDVVKGIANVDDCIVNYTKKNIGGEKMIPAPFRKEKQ